MKKTKKNNQTNQKGGRVSKMADSSSSRILAVIAWLTGILVSLAVGFGMINGVLAISWLPDIITTIAGWIVVIGAVISVIMAVVNR